MQACRLGGGVWGHCVLQTPSFSFVIDKNELNNKKENNNNDISEKKKNSDWDV